jgi:hypothetical protein
MDRVLAIDPQVWPDTLVFLQNLTSLGPRAWDMMKACCAHKRGQENMITRSTVLQDLEKIRLDRWFILKQQA